MKNTHKSGYAIMRERYEDLRRDFVALKDAERVTKEKNSTPRGQIARMRRKCDDELLQMHKRLLESEAERDAVKEAARKQGEQWQQLEQSRDHYKSLWHAAEERNAWLFWRSLLIVKLWYKKHFNL